MMFAKLIKVLLASAVLSGTVFAQSMDDAIAGLTSKLSKTIVAKGRKKLAIIDFADLQGRPTELGRFLAEQLAVELVNAEGVSLVDRANIKNILAEHKLSEEGLVNPENAKKLGQFAGVDAILIGTVTSLDDNIVLTVKAISTETAEVVAAAKATFSKTKEVVQLSNHSTTSSTTSASPNGAVSDSSNIEPPVLATKEIGDLKVILKNIRKVQDGYKQLIKCEFEFMNCNLNENIIIAANGTEGSLRPRIQLLDSNGTTLGVDSLNGLPLVMVKFGGDPSAIANRINHGGMRVEVNSFGGWAKNAWGGDFSTIPSSKSIRVTMLFNNQGDQLHGGSQIDSELVVGTGTENQPANCRLVSFALDGFKLP